MTENGKETRTRLVAQLDQLAANGKVLKTQKSDNLGPLLGRVYFWQEARRHAEEQLKVGWKTLETEGLISDDDALRAAGVSEERIVVESNDFSVIVKIDSPRQTFSRDRFIKLIAKRFKLDEGRLEQLAKECVTETRPPLSKRVLEA